MNRSFTFALAIGVFSLTTPAFARQPAAADAARQESVIQQAMRTYQAGLDVITATAARPQPGTATGDLREIRLEEAVTLALEKNLDIQVAKLEPESLDFLIAGFRNTYRPSINSTVGLRDQYALPTSSLNGGQRVNNGTPPTTSSCRRTSVSTAAATRSTGPTSASKPRTPSRPSIQVFKPTW